MPLTVKSLNGVVVASNRDVVRRLPPILFSLAFKDPEKALVAKAVQVELRQDGRRFRKN